MTNAGSVATGGLGSGQFEDSSNGLILATLKSDASPNNLAPAGRFLIATNAASNSVSVFRVGKTSRSDDHNDDDDDNEDNDDDDDDDNDDDDNENSRASRKNDLTLVEVEPSNGEHPVSVTVSNGVVYVLNSGDAAFAPPPNCSVGPGIPNITGFRLSRQGSLAPIPESTRLLSGDRDSGCAQVSFTPDGQVLIVTERTADGNSTPNRGVIETYLVKMTAP